MKKVIVTALLAGSLSLAGSGDATAQDEHNFLAVGTMAPDVEVVGATRHGVLKDPVMLSDYRGETLVYPGVGVLLQSQDAWLNDSNGSVP